LRDAVVQLLAARGHAAEARLVEGGRLHLLPGACTWSVGSREVLAHSFELSLDARAFARLEAIDGGAERVKDALADAVASGATMLAELFVVLELPETGRTWSEAYRSAPRKDRDLPVDADSVLRAAVSLLDAQGFPSCARLLERGSLAVADLPSSGEPALRRWVIALSSSDLAEALRSPRVVESLLSAVRLAATRPREIVASVELAAGASESHPR
jgi:hypothetical protein